MTTALTDGSRELSSITACSVPAQKWFNYCHSNFELETTTAKAAETNNGAPTTNSWSITPFTAFRDAGRESSISNTPTEGRVVRMQVYASFENITTLPMQLYLCAFQN
jgi:hypothetical protein